MQIILIDCMIFFATITRCYNICVNTFLAQLDSRILCLQNAFLWTVILMALCVELMDTFCLWIISENIFFLFLFLVTLCLVVAVLPCIGWIPIHYNFDRPVHEVLVLKISLKFVCIIWMALSLRVNWNLTT